MTFDDFINGLKNPRSALHSYIRAGVFLHDVLMIPVAWYLAYWLRFNLGTIPENSLQVATLMLPVVIICQSFSYFVFGLYRGIWRFASLYDFIRIGKSVYVGALIATLVIFAITGMQHVPRSVIPLYMLLLFVFLGGNRALYRSFKDQRMRVGGGKRVLIIGAGESAQMLARDMLQHARGEYLPVGMIDDDPDKLNREIHGIKVLGGFDDIPEVALRQSIDLIVIAIPSLSSTRMQKLVSICESAGTDFKTLPKLEDMISGQVTVNAIQEVSIEDLLGREKVELDRAMMQAGLSGKVILVTGGGGSIGTELCRQVAGFAPDALIVFERSEFNLYRIQTELENRHPQLNLVTILGDVCDRQVAENVMQRYRPDMVFHAAAYKHVPILQAHPAEAVKNNITGTRVAAEAASRFDCDKFVFISTDKAVNPTNILGATKRAGEIYCEGMNTVSSTRYITVRFGNVLGSDGSVVPLFREQIRAGGPLTVTHPDMTRYFMTIRESCQLILQASVVEQEGGIYVLDMGDPVRIDYLAEQMIRLSGKEPSEDIEIQYVGLRPGEKLYEELFYEDEAKETTANDKVFRARHASADWRMVRQVVTRLEQSLDTAGDGDIKRMLAELVPQYRDSDSLDIDKVA
ncbi:MAG: nucleoside-diphosphate sugar epimerase/dehydratase [Gammaproteobacteria bacterium]|nr:nucleoside-diphosphate sugar epimerase/dehydratase [Gammaproteobacteria bacterium]